MSTQVLLDERDQRILTDRVAAYDGLDGPRMGDWVRFADGVTRRISHIWPLLPANEDGPEVPASVQTSDGGSYYLGDGYVSMSGSLYGSVPAGTLTATGETLPGSVWFFHHDFQAAHNGVNATIPFRMYECSLPATR